MVEEVSSCHICGSEIPDDSSECPECGLNVDLFDIDEMETELEDEEKVEKVFESILTEEKRDETELLEQLKEIGGGTDDKVEGAEERGETEEETEEPKDEEETEEEITFECPVCETEVSEDDTECPECGAIFEE